MICPSGWNGLSAFQSGHSVSGWLRRTERAGRRRPAAREAAQLEPALRPRRRGAGWPRSFPLRMLRLGLDVREAHGAIHAMRGDTVVPAEADRGVRVDLGSVPAGDGALRVAVL